MQENQGHRNDHEPHPQQGAPAGDPHAGHDSSGHDQHAGHSPAMFRDKFWLSLALTIPVVYWSAHLQDFLGYRAPAFAGSAWIPPLLGTVIVALNAQLLKRVQL